MQKEKSGFTLAEVLVTLMIIGVIASITIPGLKNSTEEREHVAQLRKAYSTVVNATNLIETEVGPISFWSWNDTEKIMDNLYVPKFNVAKNCQMNGGCFDPSYTNKDLSSTPGNDYENDQQFYTFVMADGSYWAVVTSRACDSSQGNYIKNACAHFQVDLNGIKKPNIIGIDIFGFVITKEGAFPYGGCPGCTDDLCQPNTEIGWACTAKLLKTGKYTW